MGRAASIDGTLLSPEEAKVSVYDRGFLYGDGAFETMRTYRGQVFALDEHIERLASSVRWLGFDLPVRRRGIVREIEAAVQEAANPESVVRVFVTRGGGPFTLPPPAEPKPLRVILVEPFHGLEPLLYRDGVPVVSDRTTRAVPEAKLTSYGPNLVAAMRARARGAHEALLIDADGLVLEGATSNFFLVIDDEILTPPEQGILAGVTRARALAIASSLGIPVRRGAIGRGELAIASEAFLTSTLREILPVNRVDGITIGNGWPGPVTRTLHEAFREAAGVGDLPMPWELA